MDAAASGAMILPSGETHESVPHEELIDPEHPEQLVSRKKFREEHNLD